MPNGFALFLSIFKPSKIKDAFQSAESRFILLTGVKFCGIACVALAVVAYQLYVNARLNFIFFRAHGYSAITELKDAYYDFVLANFVETIPLLFVFLISVFFLGLYTAIMILRPFKNIGAYSLLAIEDRDTPYEVDQFAGHRLVTQFSELFFDYLRLSRVQGKLEERSVPPQYMGIHGPVFDGAFLFHFCFLIVIMTIASVAMIMHVASDIHENTVQLAIRMLKVSPNVTSYFFSAQSSMLDELWILAGVLVCILNIMLALHLYKSVSGAAFGIFATMRSFIKGNYSARVHLLGYSYLRDSTRNLNKYLDWIQKNIGKGSARS